MAPQTSGALTYWHSGGSIESRMGALSDRRAVQILRFFISAALAAFVAQDSQAASFCARMSRELALAMVGASAWRRIA
jgi:hypothetical protein